MVKASKQWACVDPERDGDGGLAGQPHMPFDLRNNVFEKRSAVHRARPEFNLRELDGPALSAAVIRLASRSWQRCSRWPCRVR